MGYANKQWIINDPNQVHNKNRLITKSKDLSLELTKNRTVTNNGTIWNKIWFE